MTEVIGKPIDRKDGPLKVTGTAQYAAEVPLKNLAYAVRVGSSITKGRIRSIDDTATRAAKGVIDVITYKNSMSLHQTSGGSDPGSGKLGENDLLPLQSDRIFYNGQHVAMVIAETFQQAEHGAALLKIEYDTEQPVLTIEQGMDTKYQPKQALGGGEAQTHKGDADKALQEAGVKQDETYETPVYHHNAMEPHATTAEWNGDQLTLYDSTQSVYGTRSAIAQLLGMQNDQLRVISPFIGGGFGSKGFIWPHVVMSAMAAKKVGRPVKLVLDREDMFTSNGRRTRTIQKIGLGAGKDGKIAAVKHETTSETSFVGEFVETAGVATRMLYDIPNMDITHSLVRINEITPCPTRAPGEAPGTFAFEVAMDELAEKLKMDPLELRLANYADKHPQDDKPWSEKSLKECYQQGADAIGWSRINKAVKSTQENGMLVGYGMATATYPANRGEANVKLKVYDDGHAVAACCTQDIGTGTYTVMAQILADTLGMPIDKVEFKLGDTIYPKGPNSGGSQTMASTGPAVRAAALQAKSKAIKMAIADKKSPLYGQQEDGIKADGGKLFLESDPTKGETYSQLLKRQKMPVLEAEGNTNVSTRETEANPAAKQGGGQGGGGGEEGKKKEENPFAKADEAVDRTKLAFHSFGAYFVKVLVDPLIGSVHVDKVVSVMDVGTILNEKTAKSQIMGGAVWGIGMALMEQTAYDPSTGRVVTKDLADYHVPVHADMPTFDIRFIGKPDLNISPVGCRGAGEIGITGITAAIVNAIYHATGKRIRQLPVTPDKLI